MHYRILTPNELDLSFPAQTTVRSFIKFDSKMRPQERWQTGRRQRSYYLSHAVL